MMERKIGDLVIYSLLTDDRGLIYKPAMIIDIYPAMYYNGDHTEISIRYKDNGDTIIEHGIKIDDPRLGRTYAESKIDNVEALPSRRVFEKLKLKKI